MDSDSQHSHYTCCITVRDNSHYAVCTGISYLGLMLPGMLSGFIKDAVGYRMFFIIVMASCAITFLVTAFLKIDPYFGKNSDKTE